MKLRTEVPTMRETKYHAYLDGEERTILFLTTEIGRAWNTLIIPIWHAHQMCHELCEPHVVLKKQT